MRRRWRDSWQRTGLPSVTARLREALRAQAAAYCAALPEDLWGAGAEEEGGGSGSSAAGGMSSLLGLGEGQGFGLEAAEAEAEGAGAAMAAEAGAGAAGQRRRAGGVLRALRSQQGVLRMLRGSRFGPAGPAAAAAHELGSELEPAAAAAATGQGQLRLLLAAAAEYSKDRVQRMRQLVGEAAGEGPVARAAA